MFQSVFDPDNLFFRMLSRGVDWVGLSLLWALLSLPVVTIGPATAALYYTVVKAFRHKETGTFGLYLRSFWGCLRVGVPATLICIPPALLLAAGHSVMAEHVSTAQGQAMYMTYYVALVIPAGLVCYLFPLMGRFEFKLGGLFRTAFALTLRHLPSTVVVVLLVSQLTIFVIEQWWPIFFAPTLGMLLASLFLERIFAKYLDEEQKAVLEDKRPEE